MFWWFLFSCFTVVTYTRVFLPWSEYRRDLVKLYDPVHENTPVLNFVPLINTLEYTCLGTYFLQMMLYWSVDDFLFTSYCGMLLIWTRMLMLWMCPLAAPENNPELGDRFNRIFTGSAVPEFRNDLFFSGHVATLILLGLTSQLWPYLFFTSAFIIGVSMSLSRVHYTIDILVAPYVAYGSYKLIQQFSESKIIGCS
jgi:hypothetical protein